MQRQKFKFLFEQTLQSEASVWQKNAENLDLLALLGDQETLVLLKQNAKQDLPFFLVGLRNCDISYSVLPKKNQLLSKSSNLTVK